jgi:hypothetical protein
MTTYRRVKAFDHVYYINDTVIDQANRPFDGRPSHMHYLRFADMAVHLPTDTLVKCRYQLVDLLDAYLINNQMPRPMDG